MVATCRRPTPWSCLFVEHCEKTHALHHSLFTACNNKSKTYFGSIYRILSDKLPSFNDAQPFFGRNPWVVFWGGPWTPTKHPPHRGASQAANHGEAPIMELPNKMSTKQVRFEQSDLAAFLLEKLKRGILAWQPALRLEKFFVTRQKARILKKNRGNTKTKNEDNTPFFFLAPGNVFASMVCQMISKQDIFVYELITVDWQKIVKWFQPKDSSRTVNFKKMNLCWEVAYLL